jgi:hypothetical protein
MGFIITWALIIVILIIVFIMVKNVVEYEKYW